MSSPDWGDTVFGSVGGGGFGDIILIFKAIMALKHLKLRFDFFNLTILNFSFKLELSIDHLNVSDNLKIGDLTLIFKVKLAFILPIFLL